MNRTLLYGEGLFETIRWLGENRKLRLHYERLKWSAETLGFPHPTYEEFFNEIKEATGGKRELYVKYCLILKGKDLFFEKPEGFESKVIVKKLPKVPEKVSLCLSEKRRHSGNPLCYHKTMNYLFNILVKREAKERGFYDGVVLNEKGFVTETSSSNLILLKGDKLFTPARKSGLLWGTTLQAISEEMEIREEYIKPENLAEADSLFVVNSLLGAVPVTNFEGKMLPCDRDVLQTLKRTLNLFEELS